MNTNDLEEILFELHAQTNHANKTGMARFGIQTDTALGISIPVLRNLAKLIKKNHALALQLWQTNIHEARLLACFIANPKEVTEELMELWVKDFNSWDICDQCCGNVFDKTPFVFKKAVEWTKREEEYVNRAGFVLMAAAAVHLKSVENEVFLSFFPIIEAHAIDERNFVKKAINWTLRQIGKRNLILNKEAIILAEILKNSSHKAARWIGSDAYRELTNENTLTRINSKKHKK
jgi:3-methyladenine DNA glycosylase AlkD